VIDFRYHLVSLVAVLLALAAGVVLGSGPLRQSIGASVSHQVEDLRAARARLQQQVAARDAEVAQRDAFVDGIAPQVVAGRLTGTPVVLVVLPGAPAGEVDALAGELGAAGATVTARVAVQPAWVDPARATFRRTLAAQVVPSLAPRPSADAGAADELAAGLAQGLLEPVADAGADRGGATALELLRTADLVAVDGDALPPPAAAALVVGGPGTTGGSSGAVPAPGGDWLPLVTALDARGAGSVVAAPRSAAEPGGLLAALRSARPQGVSTVDSADTGTGRVGTVLALAQQLSGGSGQYGTGAGAVPVPPVAPAG
jgi:Copper transport outer membrane protein, MctB